MGGSELRFEFRRFKIRVVIFSTLTLLAAAYINFNSAGLTSSEQKAIDIYKRLTGTVISPDDTLYLQILEQVRLNNLKEAARLVTDNDPDFYNVVVRDMFARMSDRDKLVSTPLNDMIATGIGITRDEIDARELLTATYYYRAAPGTLELNGTNTVYEDELEHILQSNCHYDSSTSADCNVSGRSITRGIQNHNLKEVLVKAEQIAVGTGDVVPHPNPAGVLTSRAFMKAHGIAGTNRRLVEKAFEEFLCLPIADIADASQPDNMISRDISRFPGGSHDTYQNKCKSCHTILDSFRPVFGGFDYKEGGLPNWVQISGTDPTTRTGADQGGMIVSKMNKTRSQAGADYFVGGYRVQSTYFVNTAIGPANQNKIGWDPNTHLSGTTVRDFGEMLANSRAFSKCMAQKVFFEVCRRTPIPVENVLINQLATNFKESGYKLKSLFEDVVSQPACLGI